MTRLKCAVGIGIALAITAPGALATCAELESWAETVSAKQLFTLNTIDRRQRLPQAFRDQAFETLFGKPALALNDAGLNAASEALGTCAIEARKARRTRGARALAGAQAQLNKRLKPFLARARDARTRLEPALAALESLPPSNPLLRSLEVLRHAGTEADLRPGMKVAEGRQLVKLLAQLPQEAAVQVQPRIAELYARVHGAVLAEATTTLATAPATVAGLASLDKTVKRIKHQLGPALDADDTARLEQAAATRREAIGNTLVAQASEELEAIPATLDGAESLPKSLKRIKHELASATTAETTAILDRTAEKRRKDIERKLVSEARAVIDGGSGDLQGLAALGQVEHLPLMSVLTEPARIAIINHAKLRRDAIVTSLVESTVRQPSTTAGLNSLAGMLHDPNLRLLTHEERERYLQAVRGRRASIASELLAEPIARLDTFDTSVSGLRAITAYHKEILTKFARHLAAAELEPFERAYRVSRERIAALAQPEFQRNLATVPDDGAGIRQIKDELKALGAAPQSFRQAAAARTREIQGKLASAMVAQLCDEALREARIDRDDAKAAMLGVGGRITTLGDFACRLKVAEHQLNAYETPGPLGREYTLKLTTREGAYLTYTLHRAEVAHGKQALVGFKVADANADKALSVEDWEGHLAMLMPFDDRNPPSYEQCEAVFDKSDSELSRFDRARMFACLFSLAR